MNKILSGLAAGISVVALSSLAASCVDHDYDLTEDIDLTVTVGGDLLTLPASSLQALRLTDIFNLEEGSSIKEAAQGEYGLNQGDYVLIQAGDPSHSDFQIGNVVISNNVGSQSTIEIASFPNPGAGSIDLPTPETDNKFELEADDITTDLVSLDEITLNFDVDFAITFQSETNYDGKATILPGYSITFDESWTIQANATSAGMVEIVDGHIVSFTKEVTTGISQPVTISLKIVKVDLTKVPEGQGLYAPGKFKLESSIKSKGSVRFGAGTSSPVGEMEKVSLDTETTLGTAVITAVTGIVDPKIDIADSQFNINDVPDFLADSENSLDIDNPRFYVTVTNTSPVAIELNAELASFSNDNPKPYAIAKLGAKNGTAPVIVDGNGTTVLLVSQKPLNVAGAKNIVVDNLGSLIRTIPDYMVFENIEAKAVADPVTLALEPKYDFTTEYEAVIPLAFGADMFLHYTDVENDWDVDDLDKYNFKEVKLTFTATNSIPLKLTPQVIGLDRNGNELTNITAEIIGGVNAGSIASPSVSPLEIHLLSTGSNIGNIDGVRLIFDAVSDQALVGENLNSNQALVFTDVIVSVIGGATINLND